MEVAAWTVTTPGEPMTRCRRTESPGARDVIVEVAGCGVCHTDLGFFYDGVPTRHEYPLTLGHEISGRVVEAGGDAEQWLGRDVVVPAVMPCGECDACAAGRGSICGRQIFPGNDVHGGFASHVRVPAIGLCPIADLSDSGANPLGLELASLSVIADAVTTPFQAVLRAGLQADDLAIFVGVGGVGGFGVQIAAAIGARVVAIDVDAARLSMIRAHGADLTLAADQMDFRELRGAVREFAAGIPTWRRRIFETSGSAAGQATAFGLLEHGGYLSIVGFTADKVELRLSNVMAFDATVQGNWGCLPEHYPAATDLVLSGRVELAGFIETRPMSSINDTFADIRAHRSAQRIVLIPD